MFRRPPKFEATAADPFKNDKLGRADSIRNLTTLMEGTDTPMVMTVSAPWGSGKSSFVKMWKAYLESEEGGKHPCIMFDAWKHDFHKEPLLAVMGEIGAFIAENAAAKKGEKIIKGCVEYLPKLLKASAGLAYLASPFIPGMGLVKDGLEKSASAVDSIGKYVFEGHADQKESLRLFKIELGKFVQAVTNNGANGPLYFFVDELDRCDPEYAIKLLESVKHFFDVEGIVFVLSVDRKKLGSMVRVRYGDGFDEDGYLKRFVDVDYMISEPNLSKFVEYLCSAYVPEASRTVAFKTRAENVYDLAFPLAQDFKMTPRDLEKAFLKLSVLLKGDFSVDGKSGIKKDGISYYWYHRNVKRLVSDVVSSDIIEDFFHPLLILLFVKEKSPEHYWNLEEAFNGATGNSELYRLRPKSDYIHQLVEAIRFQAYRDGSEEMRSKIRVGQGEIGDIMNMLYILSNSAGYWRELRKDVCARIEHLDNITFLKSEGSSDKMTAA